MKKRRPTIPLSDWKLAVDLVDSRNIQNQEGTPAYNCTCDHCIEWKHIYKKIIPKELFSQFYRAGIDLKNPTDLYGTGSGNNERVIRVLFHCAGKILTGPNNMIYNKNLKCDIFNYQVLRNEPYFSFRVLPQRASYEATPMLKYKNTNDIICIDIRLSYPASYLVSIE